MLTENFIGTNKYCHTPIFDLTSYIHTPSDPEYSLTFQRKIRQKGILKYIMFGSESDPLLSLSLFFLFTFIF